MTTNREQYFKRHNIKQDSLSKEEISKISKIPMKIVNEVLSRGAGAYDSNPESVRLKSGKKDPAAPLSKKMSKEQWKFSRLYSFVNKMESNRKLNHDTDLAEKVSWYKKK